MTIRIGMEAPTGHVSVDDENLGFRLALRQAPVEYVYAARGVPLDIAGSARRLVEDEKVNLLLAFYGGPASNDVAEIANRFEVPYLFPHTYLLPEWAGRYVFTSYPRADGELRLLRRYLEEQGLSRICVLRADNQYGDFYADGLGTLPSVTVAEAEPASLDDTLREVYALEPDAVMMALYPTQSQRVMQARAALPARDIRWFTAGPLTDEWSLGGMEAEGVAGFCYFPDPQLSEEPGVQAYRRDMAEVHPGHRLNRYSLFGYAYGLITLEAMRRADFAADGPSLVQALESLSGWECGGIMPPVSFSPTAHHAQQAGLLCEVRDGRFTPLTGWLAG